MRIRQIVFAAQDLAASRQRLADLLQLDPPFRDPGVAEFGIDNAVFTFGDQFIEVISPTRSNTACGRHLERHGDGGYMLLVQTDDFERERIRLAALGVRSVWNSRHDDISAMHLHPKDVGAAIVSVDQPKPAASWRWGGPDWRVLPGPRGAQRVRGLALISPDPAALAQRWAKVLDRPAPVEHGKGWRLALQDGFAQFDLSSTGREGVSAFALEVQDQAAVLKRAQAMGLAVDGAWVELLGARLHIKPLAAGAVPPQQPALGP
jgi:hypothetical protein